MQGYEPMKMESSGQRIMIVMKLEKTWREKRNKSKTRGMAMCMCGAFIARG